MDGVHTIAGHVADGASVYVHCSAGIHRTGMIAYAVLRYCGVDERAASEALARMRDITREGVGIDRIAWGDRAFGGRESLSLED